MIRFRLAVAAVLVLSFSSIMVQPAGQGPFRASDQELEQLITRLETHSISFHSSFKEAIANSFLSDTQIGIYMKKLAQEFEELAVRLKKRVSERKPISSDVQEVLNRAEYINSFLSSYELDSRAHDEWKTLRADLDLMARYYRIETRWNTPITLGIPEELRVEALENRIIGTYELDKIRSNDVQQVIRRAVSELPQNARVRLQIALFQRLRSPKLLAIDRNETKIAFGSSLQDARIYDIVGRAQIGSNELVATLLYGGHFRINTGSDSDGIYSVTFGSTNLGSRLQVFRTAMLNQFKRPIVVSSYYTKISDTAIFELSEEEDTIRSPVGRNGVQNQKRN